VRVPLESISLSNFTSLSSRFH